MLDLTTQTKVERLICLHTIYRHLEQVDDKRLQQCVSSVMRFDTPLIWVVYKSFAYRGMEHAINTMGDLRKHCSNPEDICAKRFDCISSIIQPISDEAALSVLWEDPVICSFLSDPSLVSNWSNYEFHEVDGQICKWENYPNTAEIL